MSMSIPAAVQIAFDERYSSKPIKHERKAFKKFKNSVPVITLDLEDAYLAELFAAANNGDSAYYIDKCCYNKSDIDIFNILLERLFKNLDETPRTLSELLEGSYTPYRFGYENTYKAIRYNLNSISWYDESRYVSNFRKFVKQIAKEGYIKATPIKNCGKVAIYLYSSK